MTEETTRVPFLVLNAETMGVDDRDIATVDLTRSILDYFGVREVLDPSAISIFDDTRKDRVFVATACCYDMKWRFVLYKAAQKFVVYLHPDNDEDAIEFQLLGPFEEKRVGQGSAVRAAIADPLLTLLDDFDLDTDRADISVRREYRREALHTLREEAGLD